MRWCAYGYAGCFYAVSEVGGCIMPRRRGVMQIVVEVETEALHLLQTGEPIITLSVVPSEIVASIKKLICGRKGFLPDQQRLTHAGELMENDCPLTVHGVQDGAKLQLLYLQPARC